MEVKVSVDGVPRVVCGITEETTCQEVVTALAQALGQPGRYMLRETFKDFERCMMASESLLETLKKYGEQAKEVQLTLLHSGPSVLDEMSRANIGRHQPCPPLRRKELGARMRRGSSSLSLHRQSLPPLSCLRPDAEQQQQQQQEDLKRPKRKSLTLMEEAWEWLENLGRGRVYSTTSDKESEKRGDKKNRASSGVYLSADKDNSGRRSSQSKVRDQKSLKSDLEHQTSCCMGSQMMVKEGNDSKTGQGLMTIDLTGSSCSTSEDKKDNLRETIVWQLSCLHDLQTQISQIDREIQELEEQQRARKTEHEELERMAEEEREQIKFWENELKAEEGYKRDLQCQFLEMRAKAFECKAKLEEYKRDMQGLDFFGAQNIQGGTEVVSQAASGISHEDLDQQRSEPDGDVNTDRKFPPRETTPTVVPPNQIKERRPTGPTELREWWTRWSEAQSAKPQLKKKMTHRSELTIYLGSTKV